MKETFTFFFKLMTLSWQRFPWYLGLLLIRFINIFSKKFMTIAHTQTCWKCAMSRQTFYQWTGKYTVHPTKASVNYYTHSNENYLLLNCFTFANPLQKKLKRQTIILYEKCIWKIVVKTCTYTENNITFREISTL